MAVAIASIAIACLSPTRLRAEWPSIPSGWHKIETSGGGGGTTNSAGANVIPKSDGTNLVASSVTDDGTAVTINTRTTARAAILEDGTGPALGVTATLPATQSASDGYYAGAGFAITTPAAAPNAFQVGLNASLAAGYTGPYSSYAIRGVNTVGNSANTANILAGVRGESAGATTSYRAGVSGIASGGAQNAGVLGFVGGATNSVGVVGVAVPNTSTAGVYGVFGNAAVGIPYLPPLPSAVGANNGDSAVASFIAYDNGTKVFAVEDSGYLVAAQGGSAGVAKWGVPTISPQAYAHTLASDASSADTSGANAVLTPGIGRGNAAGSTLTISTPDATTAGSTVQTVSPRMIVGSTVTIQHLGTPMTPYPLRIRNDSSVDANTGIIFGNETYDAVRVASVYNGNGGFDWVTYPGGAGSDQTAEVARVSLIPNPRLLLRPNAQLVWNDALLTAGGNFGDIGLARDAAGVVKFTDGSTGSGTFKITTGAGAGKVLTSDANGVASWADASGAITGLTRNGTTSTLTYAAGSQPDWAVGFAVTKSGTGQEDFQVATFTGADPGTSDPNTGPQIIVSNANTTVNNHEGITFSSSGGKVAGIFGRNLNHDGWPSMRGELVFSTSSDGNPTERGRFTREGYFVIGPNGTDPGTNKLYVAGTSYVGGLATSDGIRLNTTTAPTCDANSRGRFNYRHFGSGVKDEVTVCAKDAGDAYAWRVIY